MLEEKPRVRVATIRESRALLYPSPFSAGNFQRSEGNGWPLVAICPAANLCFNKRARDDSAGGGHVVFAGPIPHGGYT